LGFGNGAAGASEIEHLGRPVIVSGVWYRHRRPSRRQPPRLKIREVIKTVENIVIPGVEFAKVEGPVTEDKLVLLPKPNNEDFSYHIGRVNGNKFNRGRPQERDTRHRRGESLDLLLIFMWNIWQQGYRHSLPTGIIARHTGLSYAYLCHRLDYWAWGRYLTKTPLTHYRGRPRYGYEIAKRGVNRVGYMDEGRYLRLRAELVEYREGAGLTSFKIL
jgi:hypothetical protein